MSSSFEADASRLMIDLHICPDTLIPAHPAAPSRPLGQAHRNLR
jgi:hypothetical protein